ncbi:probable cytochrome P450 4p3, partial [Chrysoperla carnea]|uniref:probable cytochrome P450 4p3 n=1 Tax=Chrysoperla carnea TaxID=189513 RepID=UPI001D061D04
RGCYYVSKLPGPPAYPIIGNAKLFLGSHQEVTNKLINIAEKYQNMVRIWIGPVLLIASSNPDIVQKLFTNEHVLEKAYLLKLVWNPVMGKSVFTSEVTEWRNHRSIVIRGFTPIILKSYFKIFVEKINILIQKLDLELNKERSFDIYEYLSRTTLDSVCGSTMGVNINSHEDDGSSSYFHAINSVTFFILARFLNPIKYPTIFYRFTQDYKMVSKSRDVTQEFTEKIISEKRRLTIIFTEEQLHNHVNGLIFGGYETTAISLSFVLLHLAAYKDIQTKLYNEILEVLGDINVDLINVDDLPKLKYMDMVLKESMRLTPTAPVIPREASQDIKIDNYTIPKGVNILIPVINIHRNPEYWENPLKFDPERFTPENIKNRHPYAYIPFGAGPRNCFGRRYAWIFMKTALVALLSRYEFHTDINLDTLRFEVGIVLKLINGHQVQITPRYKYRNMVRVWIGPIPLIGSSNPDIVQKLLTNEHVLEKAYLLKTVWSPVMGKSVFILEDSNFTEEQLHNETNVLIFAGYETTAITLSFLLLHLAVYKDIQTKLYNEIIEVLGDQNVLSMNVDDLPELIYMDMVLKESMRLTPTAPVISREASQDIKIDNYTIPKGANILIPIINIHRNPEYWENPLKFDPERFTSENMKNRHPYAYMPFGAGPRSCLGRRYAWIFMKTALVALLSRYEFHTDINLDTLRFEAGMSLKLVNGYPVRITPRYKS